MVNCRSNRTTTEEQTRQMNLEKWVPCQQDRFVKKLCVLCGRNKVTGKHIICLSCRKLKRNKYNTRLSQGLCPACGNKRQPQDNIYCTACRVRQNDLGPRYRNLTKNNQYDRRLRNSRRREGVCTNCGRRRDNPKFLLCSKCRLTAKINRMKRKVKQ